MRFTQLRFVRNCFIPLLTGVLLFSTGCSDKLEDLNAAIATSSDSFDEAAYDMAADSLRFEGEPFFRNIRQLTFGGNNAEAYWSADSKQLIFQSDWSEINSQGCDQIYVMNADGSNVNPDGTKYDLVSTGRGRTTCAYFLDEDRIVYGSTHEANAACPPPVFRSTTGKYVWPVYDSYDIYTANQDGSETELLIGGPGYDAEATVSPDGRYVIFTSTRSGDLELYRYDVETKETLQLTTELGYDGGAFFSPDSKKIVWRASRPTGEAAADYKELLANGLVEPTELNIFVADADGSNVIQVTDLEGANWAPFFHPDGKSIVFTTNHHMMETDPRVFDVFTVGVDGTGLKQVTKSGMFDGFPMFSPDGKQIAFSSNRNNGGTSDTNVFVAEWVD